MVRPFVAAFMLGLVLCTPARAMNFAFTANSTINGTVLPSQLTMSGSIVPGDFDRFTMLLKERPMEMWFALKDVRLSSPGGDVREAMLLAALLRQLYVHTQAQGDCASACFVLWMSGSWRWWRNGRIGVHRPSFQSEYFKSLPVDVAQQKYSELSTAYRTFLLDQGLPQSIYEKLMSMSSEEIYWLTESELLLIGGFPPYYDELLRAACPSPDTDEKRTAMRKCDAKLSLKMKAKGFDAVLKSAHDPWWDRARITFLQ